MSTFWERSLNIRVWVRISGLLLLVTGWGIPAKADITTGLIGKWSLDDASGTNANDSTANNNDGTLVNSPTWTTGCKINGCLTFNGTTQLVTLGDPATLVVTTGEVTLAAWVNVT